MANLGGGIWSGPGINEQTGVINLQEAGGGDKIYNYLFQAGTSCEQSDDIGIHIEDPQSEVEAGDNIEICEGPDSFQLPEGMPLTIGYWEGQSIRQS